MYGPCSVQAHEEIFPLSNSEMPGCPGSPCNFANFAQKRVMGIRDTGGDTVSLCY